MTLSDLVDELLQFDQDTELPEFIDLMDHTIGDLFKALEEQ